MEFTFENFNGSLTLLLLPGSGSNGMYDQSMFLAA